MNAKIVSKFYYVLFLIWFPDCFIWVFIIMMKVGLMIKMNDEENLGWVS